MPVDESSPRRIAVTGGATAGHILPALEFLQAYRQEFGATGIFIGCETGMATKLVPARGENLELVPALPWAREGWLSQVRAVAVLPAAILEARRLLLRHRTQLVIGTGGYVSFSVCLAAHRLGLPVVIHESNVELGIANRTVSRFATLVCVGFEETADGLDFPVTVTGTPAGNVPRADPPTGPPWHFIVLGGSEGSPVLNRDAPPLFGILRRSGVSFSVRHIAGHNDTDGIARAYRTEGVDAQVDGFVNDMIPVYNRATLAITSAGARTMAELSAAGVPSILIPLPGAADNHQFANARAYASRGGALLPADGKLDPDAAARQIRSIVEHESSLRRLRECSAACAHPAAAVDVVRACERLLVT